MGRLNELLSSFCKRRKTPFWLAEPHLSKMVMVQQSSWLPFALYASHYSSFATALYDYP